MRRILTMMAAAAAVSSTCLAAADRAAAASCTVSLGSCIVWDAPPTSLAFGTVNAATTTFSAEQTMNISAGNNWGLKISSDLTGGKMKEWTGAAYVGAGAKVMYNALGWRLSSLAGVAQGTSYANLSTTPASVLTNRGSTDCILFLGLCHDVAVGVRFRLQTSFFDANAGANDYRIQVTYDAQLGY